MAHHDRLHTPVVLLMFRRPDTTARVFAEIARAQPPKLLVVADGPRPDRPDEAEQCAATRAIIEQVDWPCEVLTNYAETNMGLRRRVSSGITWAFEQVDEAIILEDDCVPHPTFFRFCQELLERYRDDERVMHISGDNFQYGHRRTSYSYYFSYYPHCWGWATWRRAWQHYDDDMTLWSEVRDTGRLKDVFVDTEVVHYWSRILQRTYEKQVDSWAYIWGFTCWHQSGLTILPDCNLVTNIGFGSDATHTTQKRSTTNALTTQAMSFPLNQPPYVIQNRLADRFTEERLFGIRKSFQNRLKQRIKSTIKRILSKR